MGEHGQGRGAGRGVGGAAVYAVIPAGGAGTRLWPRSVRAQPKHTLTIGGNSKSLLEETCDRVRPLVKEVLVLTEAAQVPLIKSVLKGSRDRDFIVEPAARGTTNAYGLAAMTLLERDPEAVMLCAPADHLVKGTAAYQASARRALRIAEATGALVTLGLKPNFPATGLGYIRARQRVRTPAGQALKVEQFVEKPDRAAAQRYLEDGSYYWNLAMFCWRAQSFVDELARLAPRHHRGLKRVLEARRRGDEDGARRIYQRLPTDAVDYAIMERTERLLLVPARFEWLDLGSWGDLHSVLGHDRQGNSVDGPSLLIDTEGSLFSAPGKLVAAIGVRELIVVDTPRALLIVPKERAQEVKRVVEALGRAGKVEYL